MKKAIISIIAILLLSIIVSCTFTSVQAVGIDVITVDPGAYQGDEGGNFDLTPIVNTIVWAVRVIGTAISILMLTILGIKYLIGSVEEKAEYKKTMWPYLLGAIFLFAGSTIVNIIYEAF